MSLLTNLIVLVENLDQVATFFHNIFNFEPPSVHNQPFHHKQLKISDTSVLILVKSSSCDAALLTTLNNLAVRRFFVVVNNVQLIQERSLKAGANLVETLNDKSGNGFVIEGPERLFMHVISESNSVSVKTQMMLNSLLPKQSEPDSEDEVVVALKAPSANPRPVIHTLNCKIMTMNHPQLFSPCPPNSRTPVPFETELFKGTCLLLLRTNPIDSHYRNFFQGTKRQFEVQVQGKFKRKPTGEIYVGADITKKMELGILTRSMCRMVLKFVGTMVNDLHYSFGDTPNSKDAEMPHLVAPLLRGMDKVIVSGRTIVLRLL